MLLIGVTHVDFDGEGHRVLSFSTNGDRQSERQRACPLSSRPLRCITVEDEVAIGEDMITFPGCRSAFSGDVNDSLGEVLRGFLRQVMSDAASDEPVLILI